MIYNNNLPDYGDLNSSIAAPVQQLMQISRIVVVQLQQIWLDEWGTFTSHSSSLTLSLQLEVSCN